jgi:uncharacterized protein YecE (DUF72 family)
MAAKRKAEPVPEADPVRVAEATELAALATEPARFRNVLTATGGFADRTLVSYSPFYPKTARTPEARLQFYASQFGFVEIDASYYTLLSTDVVQRWVASTPNDFHFDVKAHPVLTGHPIELARLPADLRSACEARGLQGRAYPDRLPVEIRRELEARFFASLEPLLRGSRLGAVLAQLPPWFPATRGNARLIESLAERCGEVPLSIEFRHKSWTAKERIGRVLDLLRGIGASYVCVDQPPSEVGGLLPVTAVTAERLAVVRFHGQNLAGWSKQGATVIERFNYLYSPAELAGWVEPLRRLSDQAETVHAVFNNCVRNYAVLNAKNLAVLLSRDPE